MAKRWFAAAVFTASLFAQTDWEGVWVDSQSNRVEITAAKGGFSIKCPQCQFEAADRIYDIPLALTATDANGRLGGVQAVSGGSLLWNATPGPRGWLRVRVEIPGANSIESVLAREPLGRADSTALRLESEPGKDGRRIVAELLEASASIGNWAPIYLYIAGPDGREAAVDKETTLDVKAESGDPVPIAARLTPQVARVPAAIVPGAAATTVTVTAADLRPLRFSVAGCEPGTPVRAVLSAPVPRMEAGSGRSAPVRVTLTDAAGNPVTAGAQAISLDGAKVEVPAGQCAAARMISAAQPGTASVVASFGGRFETVRLSFLPPFRLAIGLTAAIGLLAGLALGFRTQAWIKAPLFAVLTALAVSFAYVDWLTRSVPALPVGLVAVSIVALLGGLAGAALSVWDKIVSK